MLNMIFDRDLLPNDIWNLIREYSVDALVKPNTQIY